MPADRSLPRLDPRDPLTVDLRPLGRRPGGLRVLRRSVPAPAGFGLPLIGVPAGARVELDLTLQAVVDGVLVSGTVRAPLSGQCGRCLAEVSTVGESQLQDLYTYQRADDDEDGTRVVSADLLDLTPAVRDAVVLDLPLAPLCRPDCRGLCPRCGARLAADPGHRHDELDPRWAPLAPLALAEPVER